MDPAFRAISFYDTGIGTHANSKHVFDINNKFTRFTTDMGIDTEAGTKASAVFEIRGMTASSTVRSLWADLIYPSTPMWM